MKVFKVIILVYLLFISQYSFSQWQLKQIAGEDGLSQNTIRSIIQDRNGYIWVGTYNGINRYDGYSMKHYKYSGKPNGLSSNIIINLFEDRDGFIWAGTTDAGVNRIDPHTGKIEVYFNDSQASGHFSEVTNLFQASSGIFFINSNEGIRFFRVTDKGEMVFNSLLSEIDDFRLIFQNIIPSISGKHWMLTPDKPIKLHQMDVKDDYDFPEVEIMATNIRDELFKKGNPIAFYEYPKNNIWVLSNKLEMVRLSLNEQLEIIDKQEIQLIKDTDRPVEKTYSKLNLAVDKNHKLWIAGNGLLINYDTGSGEIVDFSSNNSLKKIISAQQAQHILIDNSNNLWLGTLNNGLYTIDLENNTFYNSNEFVDQYNEEPFHKFPILAMCEDYKGNIWMGTQGEGGVAVLEERTLRESVTNVSKGFWKYDYIKNNSGIDPSLYEIKRMITDRTGDIWVGGKAGVSKISYSDKIKNYKIKKYNKIFDDKGNLIERTVFALCEDKLGNIWVGYWDHGLVKLTFNRQNNTYKAVNYTHEPNNPKSLSNNYVRDIFQDGFGNIWVGTISGLNRMKEDEFGNIYFDKYFNDPENNNSLSNNYILDIFQGRDGYLYVGTFGGGLNRIDISNKNDLKFSHYSSQNGLPSDVVYQIREDFEGDIWMQHIREISKLNTATAEVTYFKKQDGFAVDEFKDNAMLFTNSGIMVSGGVNGFTFFQPNNLLVNTNKPQLTITDFKLFDKSVQPLEKIDGHLILSKSIDATDKITLPYDLNSIEFVFSSMHFSNPQKNRYRYILEGFNDQWQYGTGDSRRFASYTNIPPGDYTFKLFGSNSAGIWNDTPKEIIVTINKPWYFTFWAITLFSLLNLLIVYSFLKIRMNHIRLKGQLELESALHEKSDEINQMKLQFFTNISHELRTPLTLIIGPLQQIMQGNTDASYLKKLNAIMYNNSVRLLKLINQLLDFRKAESGTINLMVQHGNLVSFIESIYNAFEEIAFEKNIKFEFLTEEKELNAWFDNDKIEKILYNLLSNAFKFTSKGKGIKIILENKRVFKEKRAVIKVIDEGVGIPKEEVKSVFDRFYQAKKESHSIHIGSGLGLAYTKRLVEIHKGNIILDSELGKGTVCTFSIPIEKDVYKEDSIIENLPQQYQFTYIKKEIEDIKDQNLNRLTTNSIKTHHENTPSILIVEDNKELQNYLVNYFSNFFNVISAINGKIGYELAVEQSPSIIISDLMMPVMGGIEMCRKIKTNLETSHIPVIILTAKAGVENEREGLETGADEFILKPFNIEILKLRVENILSSKQAWIHKFKTNSGEETWKELSNNMDQDFIEKSVEIINRNLDNPDFTVENFALNIGISRSSLFNKIKAITGQSSSEFIRNIRLNKATEYIKLGKYSITEIVFMVGFSDPKYFRTCFKKKYNQTPSEYLKAFKSRN